jgi:EAL domain-containing protein (putative c-di-GMP-specific phosphodiesterase class I)
MIINLVMTISDMIACEMDEIWYQYPLWVMYLVNIIYFISFILRGWALFDYTAEECNAFRYFNRTIRILTKIPAGFVIVLILLSPFAETIFHFGPEGYYNSGMYRSIYLCTYFYLAISVLYIFICWRNISVRMRVCLLVYNAVLIIGIMMRSMFDHTLVTSYFSILAILVIYLSSQNPDLFRDKRTGLFNRDAFDRISGDFLIKDVPFHCIVAKADNYDTANALYGEQQVSRSLRMIGVWMIRQFTDYYVFYFGSGDFLMLRKGLFEEKREEIIPQLRERFAESWKYEDTEVTLSMSVMVLPSSVLSKDEERIDDLIRYSFERAYLENRQGHLVVGEGLREEMNRLENVEAAITRAMNEHSIEVYLQPIWSTEKQRITGAEALARLNDPELGFIPPSEFIGVAEKTGDIMELGRQIFEKACEIIAEGKLQERGIETINVNLSPAQCMNAQLAEEFTAIAQRYNLPMEVIEFEITETFFVEDRRMLQKQMGLLQESGALFALDDFGTGTSNLSRLLKLPIRIVKLDLEVVWSFFRGESHILPDLIRMFQRANMKIVAEGVETQEMKDMLEEMGCDYIQGYYFSKPIPPEEFLALLDKESA